MMSNPPWRRPFVVLAAGLAASFCVAAAPDEDAYGAGQGYSAGTLSNWYTQDHMVGAYSAMETLFPVRTVRAGQALRALPRSDAAPDWPFIQRYLDSHPATGLLVLKDGKVLVERYQYGRQPEHRFTSFSMAKTLVAMAIGVAVSEGKIASIDDPVERYEPALAATAWKGVAIRHVLNMSSGVRFDETYDKPNTDIAALSRTWARQGGGLLAALGRFQDRDAAAGDRFKYISADTQVLAQVLTRAVGQPLADYVSDKLWQPLGAEADAVWITDPQGMEAAYCCMSARLRDWGRLGLLLAERGQRDGQSVIPAEWVDAATTVRLRDGHLQPGRATPYFGYGFQTWVFPDRLGFALLGVRGQSVFVHPRLKLVMVQTAVWRSSSDLTLSRQRDALWRDIVLRAERLPP
ncbi:MAG: class C beta-lactamase-related serine hydrolase [Betaproteobacteria bacterium]|nr:class C beta-lactamase-related serine hydrolase [Betaproteobacteria bacterium]